MRLKKILAMILTALLLTAGLTGCSALQTQFADYDVSGYISALLKSSYSGNHDDYMVYAKTTLQKSEENSTATITNAAINFCNAYSISPSDEQLAELEAVMAEACKLVKYTVKDEQKIDTGYYIEVDIEPLLTFQNMGDSIEQARSDSKKHLLEGQATSAASSEESSDETEYDEGDGYDEYGEEESSKMQESSSAGAVQTLDENTAFINEVIRLCKAALQEPTHSYGSSITIPLDIRQTDSGELQMDLTQIEKIDDTVISFSK